MPQFTQKQIQNAIDELIELVNEFCEPEHYLALNGFSDEKKALLAQGMLFYAELDYMPKHLTANEKQVDLTLAHSQNVDDEIFITIYAA